MLHSTSQHTQKEGALLFSGMSLEIATGLSLLMQKHWFVLEIRVEFFTQEENFQRSQLSSKKKKKK